MNRDEIMNMQPGRALDKLVGKTLFNGQTITKSSALSDKTFYALVSGEQEGFTPLEKGKTLRTVWWRHTEEQAWDACPHYSTDISAAWEVVEKLRDENCKIVLEASLIKGWYVNVKNEFGGNITGIYEFETAPEAICMSALLTLIKEDTP